MKTNILRSLVKTPKISKLEMKKPFSILKRIRYFLQIELQNY